MRIAFVDNRLALDHALALAHEGHDVYYFHEWRYRYGRVEDLIGWGLHKNLHPVPEIWGWIDECDLVVIADVGYGYLGDYLRKKVGKPVFNGSVFGDNLENARLYAASVMDSVGVKHPKYHEVIGVERLIEFADEFGYPFYLKVDMLRGNLETSRIEDKTSLLATINKAGFGPFQNSVRFIVSEPVEGVELGVDAWFNGEEFIRPYHWGNEIKGSGCCFGKWVDESVWDDVLDRMAKVLRGRYWGTMSFEAIYDGEDLYVLDITSRFAKPAGALQYFSFPRHYGEILLDVASGEYPELEPKAKYTAQINLDLPEPNTWVCLGKYRPELAVSEYGLGLNGDIWIFNRDETGNLVHYLAVGDDLEPLLREADMGAFRLAEELGLGYSSLGVKKFRLVWERMKAMGLDF